jgi:hypothetical protein
MQGETMRLLNKAWRQLEENLMLLLFGARRSSVLELL